MMCSAAVTASAQSNGRDTLTSGPWLQGLENRELKAGAYIKDGKLNFSTKDNKFHLWFDNRIYTDVSFYFQDQQRPGGG